MVLGGWGVVVVGGVVFVGLGWGVFLCCGRWCGFVCMMGTCCLVFVGCIEVTMCVFLLQCKHSLKQPLVQSIRGYSQQQSEVWAAVASK